MIKFGSRVHHEEFRHLRQALFDTGIGDAVIARLRYFEVLIKFYVKKNWVYQIRATPSFWEAVRPGTNLPVIDYVIILRSSGVTPRWQPLIVSLHINLKEIDDHAKI